MDVPRIALTRRQTALAVGDLFPVNASIPRQKKILRATNGDLRLSGWKAIVLLNAQLASLSKGFSSPLFHSCFSQRPPPFPERYTPARVGPCCRLAVPHSGGWKSARAGDRGGSLNHRLIRPHCSPGQVVVSCSHVPPIVGGAPPIPFAVRRLDGREKRPRSSGMIHHGVAVVRPATPPCLKLQRVIAPDPVQPPATLLRC